MTIETKIAKNGNVIVSINGKNIAAAKAAQKAIAAVDRRYNSVLEIVNHNGDKYQLNTWEERIICRDHDRAVKKICNIIRDFAHGKIKSNVKQAATNEEETTMTKSDKIAAIEAEIKAVIAERTDAYDELEAAEANDEISQDTIDRINEDIEDLSNQYWKLTDELEAAKTEPEDEPPTPETDGSEDAADIMGKYKSARWIIKHCVTKNGRHMWSNDFGFLSKPKIIDELNHWGLTIEQYLAAEEQAQAQQAAERELHLQAKRHAKHIERKIRRDSKPIDTDTDVFDILPSLDELNDVDDIAPVIQPLRQTFTFTPAGNEQHQIFTSGDVVTFLNGKLHHITSTKYAAWFSVPSCRYAWHTFKGGKIYGCKGTNDEEEFFAEMERRGACSFGEPAQMTDATFEQLLNSRKPIDVVIKEDPQTREEYYAAEGQRLSEEQFAAAMIHDEYVEILNTVEFYREHHGLTLAQAEQIYIYNLDEDNIVEGHVDQMIAQFKAENNPDPDDEPPTPEADAHEDTKADYAKLEGLFADEDPPKSETNALVMLVVKPQIEGDIAIYRRRKSISEALTIANEACKIFGDRISGQVLKVNPDNHNDSEIVAVIERGSISDEKLLPDETRPATDNPAVVDENVRDVKFELDEANGIFRENFDGLRNEILAAFDGNADAKQYVLDVTAEMDELRDNIRKLEIALYHARRGEQFTIPNWRKIPADDCDEAEPVTEETILAVNETIAAINDAAPDGWEIFYDCDNCNFAVDYRDKPVINIDSLALARILPADKFFARFLPLVDDRAHEDLQLKNLAAEVDSLQEMRGELQHDPERLAIIDELISEAKSEAGRILAS